MKHLFILLSLLSCLNAMAQTAGSIDSTFGTNGLATTTFPSFSAGITKVVIQPDNKILAIGYVYLYSGGSTLAICRYKENGNPDFSFGDKGIVLIKNANGFFTRSALLLQPNGRIIVAVTRFTGFLLSSRIVLYRFLPNGKADSSFGDNGAVSTKIANAYIETFTGTLQDDGKIVVLGTHYGLNRTNLVLIRYLPDGVLDTSFGIDGVTSTSGGDGVFFNGYSIAMQADDKILVGGSWEEFFPPSHVLVRYNSNGILDQTFGAGGIVKIQIDNTVGTLDLAVQDDGKIVGTGYSTIDNWNTSEINLYRINADGSPDISFGMNGIVTTGIPDAKLESYSLVIQPDSEIVIAGSHYASLTGWDFMVARYNSDGEPDMDFGNNGIAVTLIPSSTELGNDCALQQDGKLIVGGEAYIGGASNFILARYITDLELRLIDVSLAIQNVLLYPVPLQHNATFEYDLNGKAIVTIQLMNLQGQLVKTIISNQLQQSGHNISMLDLGDLPAGNYILQFAANQNVTSIKVIKQ